MPADAWYAGTVQYCRENSLMAGTSDTTFAPETTLTCAMLVTILWRQAEKPVVNYLMSCSSPTSRRASGTAKPSAGRPVNRWWPVTATAASVPTTPSRRNS
ncbi:MAG: hypothetical protein HFF48_05415 [Lawsonibacter sp.]|nr:hypothetical protein [Lawsonibacter sp.]